MDGILKPGDPCPCCGQPILTSDPDALMLLTWIAWVSDQKGRPENGAAGQG